MALLKEFGDLQWTAERAFAHEAGFGGKVDLFAPGVVSVRLADRVRYRGRLTTAAEDTARAREEVGAVFQRCVEAFPASTLGL
jgi:hypothetical protein